MAEAPIINIPFDSSDNWGSTDFGAGGALSWTVPVNNGGTPDYATFANDQVSRFGFTDLDATHPEQVNAGQFNLEFNALAIAAQLWEMITEPYSPVVGEQAYSYQSNLYIPPYTSTLA